MMRRSFAPAKSAAEHWVEREHELNQTIAYQAQKIATLQRIVDQHLAHIEMIEGQLARIGPRMLARLTPSPAWKRVLSRLLVWR